MNVAEHECLTIPASIVIAAHNQNLISKNDINKYHSLNDHDFWFTMIRVRLEVKRKDAFFEQSKLKKLSILLDKYFAARAKKWTCGLDR